jgi:hypothetical protein
MTTHHNHAVIWIDHLEARVFQFNASDVEKLIVRPDNPSRHIHHKANSIGSGHAADNQAFLHAVAEAVSGIGAVLVTGPGLEKTALVKHIERHDPKIARAIVGVEKIDHPSDPQLVAHARHYFRAADRMKPASP